jgi:hypothetical protein
MGHEQKVLAPAMRDYIRRSLDIDRAPQCAVCDGPVVGSAMWRKGAIYHPGCWVIVRDRGE